MGDDFRERIVGRYYAAAEQDNQEIARQAKILENTWYPPHVRPPNLSALKKLSLAVTESREGNICS